MGERVDLESLASSSRIEGALGALFGAVTPDTAFVAGLERQLVARAVARPAGESPLRRFWARWVRPFGPAQGRPLGRRRWAVTAAGLVLVVAVALTAIGPQRVLAEIQRLLGYVPGVGFVDLEETRVLASPVEVTREGVALCIEQVLGQPGRTVVVIRSEGLPPEEQLWPGDRQEESDFSAELRLPDGQTLTPKKQALRLGAGTLTFPPLPDGVYRVTLALSRLPLVPPSTAPEDWEVPLPLRPATGELVTELFPQPYAPSDASDTHAGITLRVLEAAHSPEETVLRLQVQWFDLDWERPPDVGGDRLPHLRDDLGHVYRLGLPPGVGSVVQMKVERIEADTATTPTPALPTYEETLAFAPASPSVQRLTLWVDRVEFRVPTEDSFAIDLGKDPQIGHRWPLDVHLTLAGFPVHITGAYLVEEEGLNRDGPIKEMRLWFNIEPVPDQDDRALRSIALESETPGFSGGESGYNYRSNRLRASLHLQEGQPIPSGLVQVQVSGARVLFHGPWNVTWTVPGAEGQGEARIVPVALHPKVSQTHAGLTLRLDEVTLTDRLTAVTVRGKSLSPDAKVGMDDPALGERNWVLEQHPSTRSSDGRPPEKDLYLKDDRGRRYEHTWKVGWQPQDGQTSEVSKTSEVSQTLVFEPVQPLARRVTLHVPAVAATLPGAVAFDVAVPDGLDAQPSSDRPWEVDIPVEIAGYRLRFTQARLEEWHNTNRLVLTSAPFEGRQGDRWLIHLRLASVTAPDGRAVDLNSTSRVVNDEQDKELFQAWLAFDVTDPETYAVKPGRYHVELDGAIVAVEGPWRLTWDLPKP